MNKLTNLKKALDMALGQGIDPAQSKMRIVARDFDEQAGTHRIQLVYEFRATHDLKVTPSKSTNSRKGRLFDELVKISKTHKSK